MKRPMKGHGSKIWTDNEWNCALNTKEYIILVHFIMYSLIIISVKHQTNSNEPLWSWDITFYSRFILVMQWHAQRNDTPKGQLILSYTSVQVPYSSETYCSLEHKHEMLSLLWLPTWSWHRGSRKSNDAFIHIHTGWKYFHHKNR